MKKVTKSRINAVENAAAWLREIDMQTGLPDSEILDHHKIGRMMQKHPKEVVQLLIKLSNEET